MQNDFVKAISFHSQVNSADPQDPTDPANLRKSLQNPKFAESKVRGMNFRVTLPFKGFLRKILNALNWTIVAYQVNGHMM